MSPLNVLAAWSVIPQNPADDRDRIPSDAPQSGGARHVPEEGYVSESSCCRSTRQREHFRAGLGQTQGIRVARGDRARHHDAETREDGFLHAYRALARFRPGEPFGAWLHRIVANAALDLQRRRKVRAAGTLPETIALPFRDPAESDELRRRLTAALEKLTERQRAVIVLHDVEGFRHAEIGEMLGIPEGTARSDLHHARGRCGACCDTRRDSVAIRISSPRSAITAHARTVAAPSIGYWWRSRPHAGAPGGEDGPAIRALDESGSSTRAGGDHPGRRSCAAEVEARE